MKTIINNATIVNNGESHVGSLLVCEGRIERIVLGGEIEPQDGCQMVDATGMYLLPGVIDDHVHFREPGMTAKADMHTESMAAAAGGVTSVLDMPNVVPQTTTVERWRQRMALAKERMHVNYGFFIGATNDNLDEILAMPPTEYPAVKLFMGSSTGNMLVDKREMLEELFAKTPKLIMTHCEDTARINANMAEARQKYGDDPDITHHAEIRDAEACWQSSALAAEMAKASGARLHIAHISTERELALLGGNITGEACIAHLYFTSDDYLTKGALIKCNPAIKKLSDRDALRNAIADGRITVVGTDHAPHQLSQKQGGCCKAASGMPMIQFSLVTMLELVDNGIIPIERLTYLMSHNPASLFSIRERGYLRKGYKADVVVVRRDDNPWTLTDEMIQSKCGWSPMTGHEYNWRVEHTFCNGHHIYNKGVFDDSVRGEEIAFRG